MPTPPSSTPAPRGASSLDPVLRPATIAVIGASRAEQTIGRQIVHNLVAHGFTGAVYPVHRTAHAVNGIRAWPSVGAIPDRIDVAVIAVPREHVLPVARECGEHGVRALVVISAGFREVGAAGAETERELLAVAQQFGMRLVGPNCMGMINTDPAISMNATFAPTMPPHGRAAFVSQSGALGVNVLDYAAEYGIGISQFVSMGNKADVSGNDLLEQWEHDDGVGVILMYVENFGNPRRFLEIARRLTRRKPVIVVKAGRSTVGARAASSHTGALAASDSAVDALLAQAGVLRAASIEELFDMAMAFSLLTPPRSRRTAILTNSGGPGIIAADALEMHGLDVVELSPRTVEALAPLFPKEASIRNPLDMIASANAAGYRSALDALLGDPQVDAAVAIFTPPLGVRTTDVAEAIGSVAQRHARKPVLGVLMGRDGLPQGKAELHQAGVPAYIFPESAARALGALARHGEWVARPERDVPVLDVEADGAARIVGAAVASGASRLPEHEALALVAAYGIPTIGAHVAHDEEEAVQLAEAAGFPVVLKVVSPQVLHKSDVGGVRLGIADASAVRTAYREIHTRVQHAVPDAQIDGILVQRTAEPGRELIVGINRAPDFGPMVMVGMGGVYVEVLHDVSFRLAPIDRLDARDMLRALRGFPVLGAVRGQPAVDLDAVADVLVRIARLAVDLPAITELDVNPLLVSGDGGVAVDARVLLARGAD